MSVMYAVSQCPSTLSRSQEFKLHRNVNKVQTSKPSIKQRIISVFRGNRRPEASPEIPDERQSTVVMPHYKPESLDSLVETSKFTKKELQTMYRGFKQECPSGQVDEGMFKDIYGQFFPFSESSDYAQFVFNAFDSDKSGSLTFEEFVTALSTLSRGTIEEKLQWIFCLYDLDGSGFITKKEFTDVITSIYDMMGKNTAPLIDDGYIQTHVDQIFKQMECPNAALAEEDFIKLMRKNDFFEESIHAFDTQM